MALRLGHFPCMRRLLMACQTVRRTAPGRELAAPRILRCGRVTTKEELLEVDLTHRPRRRGRFAFLRGADGRSRRNFVEKPRGLLLIYYEAFERRPAPSPARPQRAGVRNPSVKRTLLIATVDRCGGEDAAGPLISNRPIHGSSTEEDMRSDPITSWAMVAISQSRSVSFFQDCTRKRAFRPSAKMG